MMMRYQERRSIIFIRHYFILDLKNTSYKNQRILNESNC